MLVPPLPPAALCLRPPLALPPSAAATPVSHADGHAPARQAQHLQVQAHELLRMPVLHQGRASLAGGSVIIAQPPLWGELISCPGTPLGAPPHPRHADTVLPPAGLADEPAAEVLLLRLPDPPGRALRLLLPGAPPPFFAWYMLRAEKRQRSYGGRGQFWIGVAAIVFFLGLLSYSENEAPPTFVIVMYVLQLGLWAVTLVLCILAFFAIKVRGAVVHEMAWVLPLLRCYCLF